MELQLLQTILMLEALIDLDIIQIETSHVGKVDKKKGFVPKC